jgi:hypothetical protein
VLLPLLPTRIGIDVSRILDVGSLQFDVRFTVVATLMIESVWWVVSSQVHEFEACGLLVSVYL